MSEAALGASEIAKLTGWHPRRVRRALASGTLPTLPRSSPRGHWQVRLSDLRAYLKRTRKRDSSEE